jgi:hypothetical protein
MTYGYRLFVYKADRRTKTGERFVKSYDYPNYSGNAMMDEVKYLKSQLYRPEDGWRLDFEPMTKIVKNLMTGEDVEIDYRTPRSCDPSSELYWSM